MQGKKKQLIFSDRIILTLVLSLKTKEISIQMTLSLVFLMKKDFRFSIIFNQFSESRSLKDSWKRMIEKLLF